MCQVSHQTSVNKIEKQMGLLHTILKLRTKALYTNMERTNQGAKHQSGEPTTY